MEVIQDRGREGGRETWKYYRTGGEREGETCNTGMTKWHSSELLL